MAISFPLLSTKDKFDDFHIMGCFALSMDLSEVKKRKVDLVLITIYVFFTNKLQYVFNNKLGDDSSNNFTQNDKRYHLTDGGFQKK